MGIGISFSGFLTAYLVDFLARTVNQIHWISKTERQTSSQLIPEFLYISGRHPPREVNRVHMKSNFSDFCNFSNSPQFPSKPYNLVSNNHKTIHKHQNSFNHHKCINNCAINLPNEKTHPPIAKIHKTRLKR